MQQNTHLTLSAALCGRPVELDEGRAVVELVALPEMSADQHGLTHGGFVFGLADYAAMLAINEPNVVLGSAEVRLLSPVLAGDTLRATASLQRIEGKKHFVDVAVVRGATQVFIGTFVCFVPKRARARSKIRRTSMNGGDRIADVLYRQGVRTLFTLCGGHISPILVSSKRVGIRVVDVRDEKNAVFAADATARMTGTVGVAAVTAGPGVTNTITAIKNAQLAQSPLILLGGATATVLRGRGALQDIDQLALFTPHVKWAVSVNRIRELVPTLEKAFQVAQEGVPGPVFVEVPVDLLYDEPTVREMYGAKAAADIKSMPDLALQGYLRLHLARVFAGSARHRPQERIHAEPNAARAWRGGARARLLKRAARPVFVLGSQAALRTEQIVAHHREPRAAVGVPVYLSGMARGLLGRKHPLWFRHSRGEALKEADLVVLLRRALRLPARLRAADLAQAPS